MPRRFDELTWTEVERLDPVRVVALLPVGAVEAHGPHLPLATDLVIAEAMARTAAEQLEEIGELDPLLLPTLAYGAAPFAAGFPGTLDVDPGSVTALIVGIGRRLAGRVACLGLANAHLDPAHLEALHTAKVELEARLPVAFPDLTRRANAERLSEEFRSGACHAGRFEGSIVLAERPELVRDDIRRDLPPNPSSLSAAIRAGQRSFEDAGLPRAYCGDPAAATAEEGRETVAVLGALLAEAVLATMKASA
jgi:creatinine amidohydrolase